MPFQLSEWTSDLRHAARTLWRTPGFTAMAVGTLGLAIGVNAGMFSVVDRVLLQPLPYGHPDRLITILASAPGSDLPAEFGVSAEFYLHYKSESRQIEDLATYNSFTSTMRAGDRVERIRMSQPPPSLFTTLGAVPLHGRLPNDADEDRVAVISYALWMTWFGGDTSVVGKSFSIGGRDRTVIGVMGPEFRFPSDGTLAWISGPVRSDNLVPGRFGMQLVARIAPGATIESVTAELNTLAKQLPARYGGSAAYARIIGQHRAIVRPLTETMLGAVARPLWVLLGAVGFVLLIACANVANLFLVRAETRQRELAVRRAIGAGRGQLIRLQMSEAVVVAGAAAVVAAALADVTLPLFLRAAPEGVPRLGDVHLNASTIWFTLAAATFAALACGLVPAIRASAPDFARLREGGRGSTRRRHVSRDVLVVGQTALALVLLAGSGLLLRSFWALRHVDPGYDTNDIFTFQIAPEGPHLRDAGAYARFNFAFMDRLRALPGVQAVGLVENIPLDEGTASGRFRAEGAGSESDTGTLLRVTFAAGDYFEAMGINVSAGRPFATSDHLGALPNVIASRSAAKMLWPNESAIGKRVQRTGLPGWYTVIGVVDDVMQNNFRTAADPLVYFPMVGPSPLAWVVSSPAFVIKTSRAEQIQPEVRAIVREIAPEAPMYRIYTMAFLADRSMVQLSFTMLTLGIAASLALILGAVGLYGVLACVVAERRPEIGVRMALGARPAQVQRMVVGQGTRVVAIGVVIGLGGAVLATRALGTLLFGVAPFDFPTFAATAAAMIAVGLLASYLPARHASSIDPIESLRAN